jgi:hypothetical protein
LTGYFHLCYYSKYWYLRCLGRSFEGTFIEVYIITVNIKGRGSYLAEFGTSMGTLMYYNLDSYLFREFGIKIILYLVGLFALINRECNCSEVRSSLIIY